jgi:hypothetical protein
MPIAAVIGNINHCLGRAGSVLGHQAQPIAKLVEWEAKTEIK